MVPAESIGYEVQGGRDPEGSYYKVAGFEEKAEHGQVRVECRCLRPELVDHKFRYLVVDVKRYVEIVEIQRFYSPDDCQNLQGVDVKSLFLSGPQPLAVVTLV